MGAALTAPSGTGGRIGGIDTLRGVCVILMTLFHLSYDLHFYMDFPPEVMFNPFMTACQIGASWGFILISGVSSRLSRSNLRRGALVLCGGVAVSAATYLWGDFVRFGILQFLGCAMVLYALTCRLWQRLPRRAAPAVYLALFALTRMALPLVMEVPHLYPFGIITPGFRSADYYPLFPWFFWFLFGTWLGDFLTGSEPPAWLAGLKQRQLSFLGRHAFAAYFIHQPVLLALCAATALLTGRKPPF